MIPNNLLGIAMGAVGSQQVDFYQFQGVTQDSSYRDVPSWSSIPKKIRANVQAVTQAQVNQMGLDISRKYKTVFAELSINAINQGGMPDRFHFEGATWEIVDATNWHNQNGWSYCLVVRL